MVQVRKALGVDDRPRWQSCDPDVYQNFRADWMLDVRPFPATAGGKPAPRGHVAAVHAAAVVSVHAVRAVRAVCAVISPKMLWPAIPVREVIVKC